MFAVANHTRAARKIVSRWLGFDSSSAHRRHSEANVRISLVVIIAGSTFEAGALPVSLPSAPRNRVAADDVGMLRLIPTNVQLQIGLESSMPLSDGDAPFQGPDRRADQVHPRATRALSRRRCRHAPAASIRHQPLEARMAQQPFSVTPRNSSRAENFGSTQTVSFLSSSFAVGGVAPASAGFEPRPRVLRLFVVKPVPALPAYRRSRAPTWLMRLAQMASISVDVIILTEFIARHWRAMSQR